MLPVPKGRAVYDAIHKTMAEGLKRLAGKAGPTAPLCVVAHSLGTVIACNYLYDLQKTEGSFIDKDLCTLTQVTPLEHGETFASSVWRDNVFATQFHPEKSGTAGLAILRNFVAGVRLAANGGVPA